jgi:hypothetical protein
MPSSVAFVRRYPCSGVSSRTLPTGPRGDTPSAPDIEKTGHMVMRGGARTPANGYDVARMHGAA